MELNKYKNIIDDISCDEIDGSDMFNEELFSSMELPFAPSADIKYVAELDKDVMPVEASFFKTPKPVNAEKSILDKMVSELMDMNIEDVKNALIKEIEALEEYSDEDKKIRLQYLFTQLFKIQPEDGSAVYGCYEQKLYADLISVPQFYRNKYVRDFLETDFQVTDGFYQSDYRKKRLLLKVYNYYDNHTEDEIEKFNYIFGSSAPLVEKFMFRDLDLEYLFSERIMNSFDKEDLCQLFRFYVYGDVIREDIIMPLFADENSKVLFMISSMAKKIKSITGHSSEFIQVALEKVSEKNFDNNFVKLLNDYYDHLVIDVSNERDFEKVFLETDFLEMRELINYTISSYYYEDDCLNFFKKITTLSDFMKYCDSYREICHKSIFNCDNLDNIFNGEFNPDKDFRPITNKKELNLFKEAFLRNIYGINLKDVEFFINAYTKNIIELENDIVSSDKDIFEVLKSIKNIWDLDLRDENFSYKLRVLQESYYSFVKENGLDYKSNLASSVVLEGLFNRMFINTYNNKILKIRDYSNSISIVDGVEVIDTGVNFDILLTSLSGVTNYYHDNLNMASKWNTAYNANTQGLSISHISNENLGVISLETPFLGFTSVPMYSLNGMAPNDIFSTLHFYNLRRNNRLENNTYIPCCCMSDQTRYGYNELLLDRFLASDKDGNLKLQPDFVVFYKMGEQEYDDRLYKQCKKIAKDFSIPIVIVDVLKIKRNEKEILEDMEYELFNSDIFNPDLLNEIVIRYMNNYTGSLTISDSRVGEYLDFSINGMDNFFSNLGEYINSLNDDSLKSELIDALEFIYQKERKKNIEARSCSSYKASVQNFILDDIGVDKIIESLRKNEYLTLSNNFEINEGTLYEGESASDEDYVSQIDPDNYPTVSMSDGKEGVFLTDNNYSNVTYGIINFINELGLGSRFVIEHDYLLEGILGTAIRVDMSLDKDIVLIENLVVSYFLENFDESVIVELDIHNFDKEIEFDISSNFDFVDAVSYSPYNIIFNKDSSKQELLASSKFDKYIEKIESMDEKKFISMFSPIIEEQIAATGEKFEDVALTMLNKKGNIRANFNKLKEFYCNSDGDNKIKNK